MDEESREDLIGRLAHRYEVAEADRELMTGQDDATLEAQAKRLGELRGPGFEGKRFGNIAPREGASVGIDPDPEHDARDFVNALFGNRPHSLP